jgi:hypothetical protein
MVFKGEKSSLSFFIIFFLYNNSNNINKREEIHLRFVLFHFRFLYSNILLYNIFL